MANRFSLAGTYSVEGKEPIYIRARYVDDKCLYIIPSVPSEIEAIINEVKEIAIAHDLQEVSITRRETRLHIKDIYKWI